MDVKLLFPLPGDTEQKVIHLTAAQLGYPKASRKYEALDFTFKRAFDGKWGLNGSYTYTINNKGNSEGYVQSDFGQDDAGITQDFDQPGFTQYAYGDLPNERDHLLKAWGHYQFNENLPLASRRRSPRPSISAVSDMIRLTALAPENSKTSKTAMARLRTTATMRLFRISTLPSLTVLTRVPTCRLPAARQ